MNRPLEVVSAAVSAIRGRLLVVAGQSERTILLGTILVVSAVSVLRGFVLARYFSIDVLSALVLTVPEDCSVDWPTRVGRHCFSDYSFVVSHGMRPDPWESYPLPNFTSADNINSAAGMIYSAAGMVPHMFFGFLGNWLHAPRLGLLGYLLALTTACLTPAVWAAWGARGLERVVVLVALGVAAIPAWTAIDRGNSLGFVVPIALVFLVALSRRRWRLAAIMVVLAALVKPQFVVLAVALFAARQWRWGGLTVAGAVITNIAAYLLWPRNFPTTILESIHNALGFGSSASASRADLFNMSFAEGLLMIPDDIKAGETGGKIPASFIAGPRSLLGYVVLVLVVVCIVALGRRIPPVMAGTVLLATASLFPSLIASYYLVFALPVVALIARDPDGPPGSGIFDRPEALGGRRRAVGLCVSLAAALTIAQMVPLGPPLWDQQMGGGAIVAHILGVLSSVRMAPVLWLIACTAIIVSYARKPIPSRRSERCANPDGSQLGRLRTERLDTPPQTSR
ncbi:MAG TPA: glycosyltransferase family 87 protein, partial [Tepidisphaeraceae bacterium]|nr:glycosyltransferase family 87 protein [Tepidisphaeraceae bacterium]